ncbi:MAG: hypothetical protein DRJ05_02180 [Bacteroidetes bacterium]|nr:MAG: hypothetical protein DRJ05_02180 [Bacteroidota bacterium]
MKTFTTYRIYAIAMLFFGMIAINVQGQELDLEDIIEVELDYGSKDARIETHVYLNSALWNFEDQFLGKFANEGGSMSGYPLFINYSGYVSISGYISRTLFAEAEFELYKGQKGEFKVTRLRAVWSPNENFRMTLGRDFPAIGLQDKVYYPTSQYRLFAIAPYAYYQILRATGWWDAGIHLHGVLPIGDDMKLIGDISLINGPGDQHKGDHYLEGVMKPNSQGYMFENFHSNARQPWDNNKSKNIAARLAFSPIENLEFGASYMTGKYDVDDKYNAEYIFGHLLYGGDRLTIACEYSQLAVQVPDSNFYGPGVNGGFFDDTDPNNIIAVDNPNALDAEVTQYSWYVSGGYKFFQDTKINYLEPVVRYEVMDSWKADAMNRGDRSAFWVGFRFSPQKHWVFKGAYLVQTETYQDLANDGFVLEMVVDF